MTIPKIVRFVLVFGFIVMFSGMAIAEESGAYTYFNENYEGLSKTKEGNIRIGHITIIPKFELLGEYDDNIYLTNGNDNQIERKVSDWITHLKPALVAKYDMIGRGAITLGYTGDFAYYNTENLNNWQMQNVLFNGDYKAPVGLIVGVNNKYSTGDDPYSGFNDYRLGQRSQRWTDALQTKVGYEFIDKFRILAYYNFYKQDYALDRDFSQNYDSNEVGAGAEMRVMPMTWAFLRYYTGAQNYNSHPDTVPNFSDSNDASYKWNRVNTGLTWDATAKISGELNLGYQWNTADNATDPYGRPYEDNNTWIARTRMSYHVTPKTRVGAELFRATQYSGGNITEYYDETGFGVIINQDVMTKGVLRAAAGYALNDYNQPAADTREDNNYRAEIGFDYHIMEWLTTGVEYRYWDRDSNYDIYSFKDNRFMVSAGIAY